MNADSRPFAPPGLPALERLDAGGYWQLALVVAPAGSGKTAGLRQWSALQSRPVAWVTAMPADNAPARFVRDMCAALRAAGLPIPDLRPESSPHESAVELLNAVAAEDFILVLDAYDVIAAQEVHAIVDSWLAYPPPRMHLVIACRTAPPLTLHRLRARRQLLEIGPGTASLAEPV